MSSKIQAREPQPSDPPRTPPASDRAQLTPEQHRRRRREFWITVVVLAFVAALLLLQPLSGLTQGVGDSGLFLLANAITVVLILLLGFLVTRNLWKVVGERRQGSWARA